MINKCATDYTSYIPAYDGGLNEDTVRNEIPVIVVAVAHDHITETQTEVDASEPQLIIIGENATRIELSNGDAERLSTPPEDVPQTIKNYNENGKVTFGNEIEKTTTGGTSSRDKWMVHFLGKEGAENYKFGDLSKKVACKLAGKEHDYRFGDITKNMLKQISLQRKQILKS